MSDFVTDTVRHAGRIRRYHAWPTIQVQTVGEHSWQVALIYEQIFGELSSPVERYIRLHDVAELVVGDIPFPTKANNPELKAAFNAVEDSALETMGVTLPGLAPVIRTKIKICDLLEMACFGMMEYEMGNQLAIPIIQRTMRAALKLTNTLESGGDREKIILWLDKQRERHTAVMNQRNN
jgi:hypothetical protein